MSKLSRRKFFGAAAAASVAVAIPNRYADRFARSLEDRPVTTVDTTDVIFRFYDHGKEMFTYPITLPSYVDGTDKVVIGANERFIVEGFEGYANDLGISLAMFPQLVTMIGFGPEFPTGVRIHRGNTLTLQAQPTGFLTFS